MTPDRICMDGFTGAMMAAESFSDCRAVLHGPGGCRSYHALLASRCYPREQPADAARYYRQYFFGQPRIPCTFIDEDSYINGSEGKLEECVPIICDADDRFNIFISSPGSALIGDNVTDAIERAGFSHKAMAIDESLISQPFSSSYDRTVRSIIERRAPKGRATAPRSVNILGLPISGKDWQDSLDELTSILGGMGVTVISAPGAGCSLKGLEESTAAELNVCVCPEYCKATSAFYESEYGIPTVFSDMGAPVGFDAVEHWARNIGKGFGTGAPLVEEGVRAAKGRVFRKLNGSFIAKRVKHSRFTVMADSSVAYPLVRWLFGYMCMIPASVTADPGEDAGMVASITRFLGENGLGEAWGADPCQHVDFVFADGHTAETQMMVGGCVKGVDIAMPSLSRIGLTPRPVLGVNGAMYILDEIIGSM